MHAAREKHGLKNVQCLVSFAKGDLDLNATDRGGCTALKHAIEGRNLDPANFLIGAGSDLLQTHILGCSPIQRALHQHLTQFTLENLPEVDEVRSASQGSILNTAALIGNEVVVTELLKRVPEKNQVEYVNLFCDFGTPLYCGAYHQGISIIEKLIEKGAQVNLVGGPAGSPLMAACANGHVEAVRTLLKKGAELQCTKFDGTTITAEEAAQQHESVLLLLRRYKEKGADALDEKIPVKRADISELDKFMVAYKGNEKRIRRRLLYGEEQDNLLGDESDESDESMETTIMSVHDEDGQEDDLEDLEEDKTKGREVVIETTEDDAKLKTLVEKAEAA